MELDPLFKDYRVYNNSESYSLYVGEPFMPDFLLAKIKAGYGYWSLTSPLVPDEAFCPTKGDVEMCLYLLLVSAPTETNLQKYWLQFLAGDAFPEGGIISQEERNQICVKVFTLPFQAIETQRITDFLNFLKIKLWDENHVS